MSNSYRTAIKRNSLSAPARWLHEHNRLGRWVFDFGCGKGDDVRLLNEMGYLAKGWDPYWAKELEFYKTHGSYYYDSVLCTYVLNVLEQSEQTKILSSLIQIACSNIFISVRRDLKEDYKVSKIGTVQRMVKLPYEITHEDSRFCIYRM